ncbi:MAG: phosphate ABC transporter permease PstA [Kiritimatiellae bacterium]|nr:phosphate ABC transporter permease PstA [Kiritimatiellia bacterium]
MKARPKFFRKTADAAMRCFSGASTVLALTLMAWVLFTIASEGHGAISAEFFTNPSKPYGETGGGIANALLGTLLITLGATVLALPPALAAGIWLAEFGKDSRLAKAARFTVNVMMGIPSVIIGLFAYGALVATTGSFSGFAGSFALAILMFPVVARTAEDQFAGVSDSLRESALALGAGRARTTVTVIWKAARSGTLTGILLAVARVSGETAPLLFTALYADAWPTGYFSSPTPSAPVLITNCTMDSPFEAMHRTGWGAALSMAAILLAVNIAVRHFGSKGTAKRE